MLINLVSLDLHSHPITIWALHTHSQTVSVLIMCFLVVAYSISYLEDVIHMSHMHFKISASFHFGNSLDLWFDFYISLLHTIRAVWYHNLNNYFQFLKDIICIFIQFFHSYVFPKMFWRCSYFHSCIMHFIDFSCLDGDIFHVSLWALILQQALETFFSNSSFCYPSTLSLSG